MDSFLPLQPKKLHRNAGILSSFLQMTRGLPQGTLLGPLCFLVNFDPIIKRLSLIDFFSCRVYGFVDDLSNLEIVRGDPLTPSILQIASQVTKEMDMRLNAKKTLALVFDTRRKQENCELLIDSISVPIINSVKLLGVYINNKLNWDDHVAYITSKAASRLNYLRKLKSLGFQKDELLISYCSFVRSILEFNSTVWGPGLTKDQTDSIEKIQRRAMSTILNLKVTERSYHDHLLVLGLDTLKKRREAALSRMGASILQNPRLRNMLPDFCNVTSARSLRQSNLLMPITTTRKRYQNSSIPAMVNLINAEFRQTKSFRGIQYVSHFTD